MSRAAMAEEKIEQEVTISTWAEISPGSYQPSGKALPCLPAGMYCLQQTLTGMMLTQNRFDGDQIVCLPGTINQRALTSIRQFWRSRAKYEKYKACYKRGILFHGSPGGGKTATIRLLCEELVREDQGIVFINTEVGVLWRFLSEFRKIERTRPVVVVLEDIDEIIDDGFERELLGLLDGQRTVDGVVYLATTNHPEKLESRIINRPARFDEVIEVPMPPVETRAAYIDHLTESDPLSLLQRDEWVKDTEGMSLAHIRELALSYLCLDQPYETIIKRLQTMAVKRLVQS